jgi:hypothetical protein
MPKFRGCLTTFKKIFRHKIKRIPHFGGVIGGVRGRKRERGSFL